MLGIDDVEELTGGGALDVGRSGDKLAARGPDVFFLPGLHRCFPRPPTDAAAAGPVAGGTGPLLARLSLTAFLAGATRLARLAVAVGAEGGEIEVCGPGQRRFELGAIGSQRRGKLAELLRGKVGKRLGCLLPELRAGVARRSHSAEGELARCSGKRLGVALLLAARRGCGEAGGGPFGGGEIAGQCRQLGCGLLAERAGRLEGGMLIPGVAGALEDRFDPVVHFAGRALVDRLLAPQFVNPLRHDLGVGRGLDRPPSEGSGIGDRDHHRGGEHRTDHCQEHDGARGPDPHRPPAIEIDSPSGPVADTGSRTRESGMEPQALLEEDPRRRHRYKAGPRLEPGRDGGEDQRHADGAPGKGDKLQRLPAGPEKGECPGEADRKRRRQPAGEPPAGVDLRGEESGAPLPVGGAGGGGEIGVDRHRLVFQE